MENKKTKIAGAIGAAAVIALSAFGGAGIADDSAKVIELQEQIAVLEAAEPVVIEKIVTETIELPVEVEKVVYQDNENLNVVMDFIEDNVDEDVTVDYILFEMDAKIEAEAWINNRLISYLSDEDYFADGALLEDYRKSEVSIKKIADAEIVDRDFEDKDLVLSYEVRIKAKESGEEVEYFDFLVTVPFEDGKLELDDLEVVELVE